MGNQSSTCMANQKSVKASHIRRTKSSRKKNNSNNNSKLDEELLQQQAFAMALFQHQKSQMRTMSQRHSDATAAPSKQKAPFNRSASARPRSIADSDLQPHHLLVKDIQGAATSALETKHFVLIHGGGYGAWCWYKSMALLEESGFIATALDLTGSGIDSTDPNTVNSLSLYVNPLSLFLHNLPPSDKVILVGHDVAGACISYAMESYPSKIAKAVFVCATMVANGERAFDVFTAEDGDEDLLLRKAQVLMYGNGSTCPPTALSFDKSMVTDLFFHRSPAKDVALASVALRPVPMAPLMERLVLSEDKYGSVRKFFVETTEDKAMVEVIQERILNRNRPERIFRIKGSDHSPFFSKPHSLHKTLVDIALIV